MFPLQMAAHLHSFIFFPCLFFLFFLLLHLVPGQHSLEFLHLAFFCKQATHFFFLEQRAERLPPQQSLDPLQLARIFPQEPQVFFSLPFLPVQ
jgi:hypothetical protein